MERPSISSDIVARYAGDAACEVGGVRGLVERHLPGRRGVRVASADGRASVELHVRIERGASIPELGEAVQRRVHDYLQRMADLDLAEIDVAVDEIAEPG